MSASRHVNIYEAKTQLSKLVDRALAGEDVVIARNGHPMVRLVPVQKTGTRRSPGGWAGQLKIGEGFDDLPAELAAAFRGDRE